MTLAYNDPALEPAASLVGTSIVPHHLTQKQFVASAKALIFAVTCTGFCLSMLAFWPGFMEFDSFDQYAQAIDREPLNDWHPVLMALLWRVLIRFHDGPEPMLLLQMALYWSGFLYLALQMLKRVRPVLACGAILIPFLPFLLNFSGVVWKDTHMAVAFFWVALILAFARPSMWGAATSLLLIFYGLTVRHNGIAAALPLLLLWGHNFAGLLNIRHRLSAALFTASAVATILVIRTARQSCDSALRHPSRFFPGLWLFDHSVHTILMVFHESGLDGGNPHGQPPGRGSVGEWHHREPAWYKLLGQIFQGTDFHWAVRRGYCKERRSTCRYDRC